MLVSCRDLFVGEAKAMPVDGELDFTSLDYQGMFPFRTPIRLTGTVTNRAGVVRLDATAAFTFDGRCDRCLAPFSREYRVPVSHILVTAVENEDSDFVLLEDYRLDLDELVQADILLELPSKSLCREDCRGLCPRCGRNRNEAECGCARESTDPRLDALKQWFT